MSDPFHLLSDYDLRHLPRHLAEAGRIDEMHWLLSLEDTVPDDRADRRRRLTGRSGNAWYVAATRDGDQRRYIDQVEYAARSAGRVTAADLRAGRTGFGIVHEFHYALSLASVRNLSANVPVRLLAALVRRDLLGQEEALSYVRQVPDPRQRAEGLRSLLPFLDERTASEVAAEALAAVAAVEDEYWRVAELGQLVPRLPAALASHAQLVADRFHDPYYSAVAMAVLGRDLDADLRARLASLQFGRANVVTEEYGLTEGQLSFRDDYLGEYAQRGLHAVRGLGELLRKRGAESITSPHWAAQAYAALADESDEFLEPAIAAAGAVGGDAAHAGLVRVVALRMAALGDTAGAEALLAEGTLGDADRLLVRCELAALGATRIELDELDALADPWTLLRACRTLLPALRGADLARMVEELTLPGGDDLPAGILADRLAAVAPYADRAAWERAFRTAARLGHPEQRMRVLGLLAARGVALGDDSALGLVREMDDEYWYGRAVDQLVPALVHAGRTGEALAWAQAAPHPHRRAALTARCAAELPGAQRGAAFAAAYDTASSIAAPASRVRALVLLAEAAGGDDATRFLAEAADAADSMEASARLRADAVAAVAAALAAHGDVARALGLAAEIVNEQALATALAGVTEHADEGHCGRILARTRAVEGRRQRGRVLTALACRVAALGAEPVTLHEYWREALQTLALAEREDFLREAVNLLPVAEKLAGPEALHALAGTSRRIMTWWP
ncbi:hypothetical protein [Couchioplanes azureus]|uniref:hypothetical protein n=1 Tax=Couchioplanes caeruleus TaxID=56438 RepID=UPI00166F800A|nr:hypothetical protein [Couchioplanes caeruleus]GGQ74733.1 hypothetical protein GCM10010166_50840 [Couchioplanes caeruleus subsp. azureus]